MTNDDGEIETPVLLKASSITYPGHYLLFLLSTISTVHRLGSLLSIVYYLYWLPSLPSTICTVYLIYSLQSLLSTISTVYHPYYLLSLLSTIPTVYCRHCLPSPLSTIYSRVVWGGGGSLPAALPRGPGQETLAGVRKLGLKERRRYLQSLFCPDWMRARG